MGEDNSIFIGNKPFMNYVTGVVMQFTTKGANTVKVKARGKFISRAVDVSEVSAKRFLDESIAVQNISIDSEEFQNQEGRNVRVSTIEIVLAKKDGLDPHLSQPIRRMRPRRAPAEPVSETAAPVATPEAPVSEPTVEPRPAEPTPSVETTPVPEPAAEPTQEPTNSW